MCQSRRRVYAHVCICVHVCVSVRFHACVSVNSAVLVLAVFLRGCVLMCMSMALNVHI